MASEGGLETGRRNSESFWERAGFWFRSCYPWALGASVVVYAARPGSDFGNGTEMALTIAVNSVTWAVMAGLLLAWWCTPQRGRTHSARAVAAFSAHGPANPAERVLATHLNYGELLTFSSHAGVLSSRHVTDGVLFVTSRRVVFVTLADHAFGEIVLAGRPPTCTGRSPLNTIVTLGTIEVALPTREVPALDAAVRNLLGPDTPADNSNASVAATHGPSDAARLGRVGLLTVAGVAVLLILMAISEPKPPAPTTATPSSAATTATIPTAPDVTVGDCYALDAFNSVRPVGCTSGEAVLQITALTTQASSCPADEYVAVHTGVVACVTRLS